MGGMCVKEEECGTVVDDMVHVDCESLREKKRGGSKDKKGGKREKRGKKDGKSEKREYDPTAGEPMIACTPGKDECPYRGGCCGSARVQPAPVPMGEPWESLSTGGSYCAPGPYAEYIEEVMPGETSTVYELQSWLYEEGGWKDVYTRGEFSGSFDDWYDQVMT